MSVKMIDSVVNEQEQKFCNPGMKSRAEQILIFCLKEPKFKSFVQATIKAVRVFRMTFRCVPRPCRMALELRLSGLTHVDEALKMPL